jgi:hypothetical protein
LGSLKNRDSSFLGWEVPDSDLINNPVAKPGANIHANRHAAFEVSDREGSFWIDTIPLRW